MRITRATATGLVGIMLAAAALTSCGQARVATPVPRPTASASVAACTAALEKAGLNTLVTAAGSSAYPAAVTRACDGLPPAVMRSAVNTAMSHLVSA